jgi:hypothetical protein
MLTVEYANIIRLLEDIGRSAEKEDSFSSIQSAIKILRMELDREMDLQEMSKFRKEVVLLDPDSEPANGTARKGRGTEDRDDSIRDLRNVEPAVVNGRAEEGFMNFSVTPVRATEKTGIRSVGERLSGTRKSSIRETDTDGIKIKLSSMKIEKIGARHDTNAMDKSESQEEHLNSEGAQRLVKCKSCGTMISSRSVVCVLCGEFIRH